MGKMLCTGRLIFAQKNSVTFVLGFRFVALAGGGLYISIYHQTEHLVNLHIVFQNHTKDKKCITK